MPADKDYHHRYFLNHRETLRIKSRNWERKHNVGGKQGKDIIKRPYPKACELCGKLYEDELLGYHHWDDDHVSIGLWLCTICHLLAEIIDSQRIDIVTSIPKYLELKARVELEYRPLL